MPLASHGVLLLCMVGNANEPVVSPAVLTREELLGAFVTSSGGLFKLPEIKVKEDRFDPIDAGVLEAAVRLPAGLGCSF